MKNSCWIVKQLEDANGDIRVMHAPEERGRYEKRGSYILLIKSLMYIIYKLVQGGPASAAQTNGALV